MRTRDEVVLEVLLGRAIVECERECPRCGAEHQPDGGWAIVRVHDVTPYVVRLAVSDGECSASKRAFVASEWSYPIRRPDVITMPASGPPDLYDRDDLRMRVICDDVTRAVFVQLDSGGPPCDARTVDKAIVSIARQARAGAPT